MNPTMSRQSMANIIEVVILVIIATGLVVWTLAKPRVPETAFAFFYPGNMAEEKKAVEKTNAYLTSEYCLQFALDYNGKYHKNIKINIIDAGNKDWQKKLNKAMESGKYSLIISEGIEFTETASALSSRFPEANFIIFDSNCGSAANIFSVYSESEEVLSEKETKTVKTIEPIPQEKLKETVNKVLSDYLNGKLEFGNSLKV